jgi:hypothetical protein
MGSPHDALQGGDFDAMLKVISWHAAFVCKQTRRRCLSLR